MNEWIKHAGGPRPTRGDQRVDVMFRKGEGGENILAKDLLWADTGGDYDIVAWRPNTALSRQEGGSHYKDLKIQPIEFVLANGLGFCEGNVIKYVTRWRAKGGVEDLRKARHYLDLLIEHEGK